MTQAIRIRRATGDDAQNLKKMGTDPIFLPGYAEPRKMGSVPIF
jgi:hypothetical protein